jgi:hypothetical protein
MTRSIADSSLRRWGLELRERLGFKRGSGPQLAVIMHAMMKTGEMFDRRIEVAA